jgi:DNA-binding CsgD family transcriptional regulator
MMTVKSDSTLHHNGLEHAWAAIEVLGLVDLPAALLGLRGQPLAANSLFKELMPYITHKRFDRLAFCDATADALFTEALMQPVPTSAPGTVRAIPIRARGEQPPMIIHFMPVRGEAQSVFVGASCVLIITPLKHQVVPKAEVLQGLFDLTPAEARVARGIGEGRTVEALAETFGLSRETIRSQLKVVLGKAGLGRQADLVAMLAGVRVSGG